MAHYNPNGKGKVTYPDGGMYEGDFIDGTATALQNKGKKSILPYQ